MFRPENIEFTIGSSVYVQTTRHGCQESAAVSVHHCAETLYMTYLRESNDVLKLTTPRQSPRKKQKFSGGFRGVSGLESEVTESVEFHVVKSFRRRMSALCQC